MREPRHAGQWTRHFFYRSEHIRTTWKLRMALAAALVAAVWFATPLWTAIVADSLVCDAGLDASDAIMIENFDHDYGVFEHAAALRRAGWAPRVIVPVRADSEGVNRVALSITELLARLAHVGSFDVVPMQEIEPISLNAANDVLAFLRREDIRSVIVVSPLFRSRRSALVYDRTLGRAGIIVHCDPVQGLGDVNTWTDSWHGIQSVAEQWLKLQYYRVHVLPFRLTASGS
jgi:hypothetical protein